MKFGNLFGSYPRIFNSTEFTGSISVSSLGGTGNVLLSGSDGVVIHVQDGLSVVLQGPGMSMLDIFFIEDNATVDLAADNLLHDQQISLFDSGTLNFNGHADTIGSVTLNNSAVIDLSGGTANTGSVTVSGDGMFQIGGTATTGAISLNDNGVPGSGTIDFDEGTLTVLGSFWLLDPDAVIDLEGGSLSVSDYLALLPRLIANTAASRIRRIWAIPARIIRLRAVQS